MPRRSPFSGRPEVPILNREIAQAHGLKALWPLGSALGQELVSGRTATAFNGATVSGRPDVGLAGFFDGIDNYFAPSNVSGLPAIDGPLTLAARVWVSPLVTSPTRLLVLTLVKDDTGSAGNAIGIELSGATGFWTVAASGWGSRIADGFESDSTDGVYPQRWHDVVITQDASRTIRVYAGGVPVTLGGSPVSGTATQTGATGIVRIGSFNSAFPLPYFNGWITDALIADRPWSPSEVWAWSDPATRWDFYWQKKKTIFVPSGIVFEAEFDADITASASVTGDLTTTIECAAAVTSTATAAGTLTGLSDVGSRSFPENNSVPTDYLTLTTMPSTFAGEWTALLWINPHSLQSTEGYAFQFGTTANDASEAGLFVHDSGGVKYWGIKIGNFINTLLDFPTLTVATDEWYPVVLRKHGISGSDATYRVYIDGVQKGEYVGAYTAPTDYITLGARRTGASAFQSNTQWYGKLAHFAFWDRALTDAELAEMATDGWSPALYPTDLVAHYLLDGQHNPEPDEETANTLTVTGTTTDLGPALATENTVGTASVSGAATVSGELTTAIELAAGVTGTASVVADLVTPANFAGALSATATVGGALSTAIRMGGALAASAAVAAPLTTAIRFTSGVNAGASVAGALSTAIQMAAGVSAAASVSGSFGIVARFDAAISSAAEVTGDLTTDIQMAAVISASSLVEAYLSAVSQFTADLSATAFAEGTLVSNPLVGTLQGPRVFTRGDLDSSPSPTVGALRDPRGHTVGNLY